MRVIGDLDGDGSAEFSTFLDADHRKSGGFGTTR